MYNFISLTALFFFNILALLITFSGKLPFGTFLSSFFIFISLFLFFRNFRFKILRKSTNETEKLEEKNNLLAQYLSETNKILETLPLKCKKVSSLFDVSCEFIEIIDPQAVLDCLVNTSAKLFPQADSIMLFLIRDGSLSLVRSLKQKDTIIKEKQGDIIEKWVLKHTQSLIIEDITKDFRFDANKVLAFKERKMHSFIASPLAVGDVILGTMRAENRNVSHFLLDDSRLLRSISDLGAVLIERADLINKAAELAIKDPLTTLYLRNYFFTRLKEEIKRASIKNTNIGLIMLDIDDFKKINDAYGHVVGDEVLKKLAQILLDCVGNSGNLICRFGGEEFIVFLIESNCQQTVEMAEKIRKKVFEAIVSFRRTDVHFSVSLGVAIYPDNGADALGLIDKVDELLYKAKREGKNRICYTGQ